MDKVVFGDADSKFGRKNLLKLGLIPFSEKLTEKLKKLLEIFVIFIDILPSR